MAPQAQQQHTAHSQRCSVLCILLMLGLAATMAPAALGQPLRFDDAWVQRAYQRHPAHAAADHCGGIPHTLPPCLAIVGIQSHPSYFDRWELQ